MKVFLETDRLILRPFTEDDADHLFALDSDAAVMRYIGSHRLADSEAYRQHIRTTLLGYYAKYEGYGYWAVIEKASGAFLGWFHLRPALDYRYAAEAGYRPGDVDLGYRFRQSAWGKGYATEGARALVHKAFAELDAVCVVASAQVSNVASTRVLEKAGLKRVAEFALPGFDQPAVKYAVCRKDWERLPMVTLETNRLVLRMLRESDLDAYAAMCADAEVMRYIGPGKPLSRAEAWRNLALMVGHWQLRGYGIWAVEDRQSGVLVGRVGLWYPEGWPGLEVGWMLRRPDWGRGFATEAARAALAYAFSVLGSPRVISLIHPDNVASIRVAERLGERPEGKAEVLGGEVLVYGIRREDWKAV
jgi:RimJ/RimL family protein N-acetyltransferase